MNQALPPTADERISEILRVMGGNGARAAAWLPRFYEQLEAELADPRNKPDEEEQAQRLIELLHALALMQRALDDLSEFFQEDESASLAWDWVFNAATPAPLDEDEA